MSNIFAGLEKLGFGNTKEVEVFKDSPHHRRSSEKKEAEKKELTEEDLIFEKRYTCPVCDHEFKSMMVRTGKVRLIGADTDLRPRYLGVDSLKYDAILCPRCGYAALNRYFNFVMNRQAKMIKENITKNFKTPMESDKPYTYDEAIMRHKMALLNTIVKNGKNSERAYTCLKMAWLNRGKREELMAQEKYDQKVVDELLAEETELLTNAFDGFVTAFSEEDFPMCGMDQHTMMYLLAELARRIGRISEAKQYVGRVIIARDVNSRIKNKALELKDLLREQEAAAEQN